MNRSNTMSVTQSVTNLVAVRIATNSTIVTCRYNPVVGIHQHTTDKCPVTSATCRNIQCQIHKIFIPRFSHIDLSSSFKNFFTFNIITKAKKEKPKSDKTTHKKSHTMWLREIKIFTKLCIDFLFKSCGQNFGIIDILTITKSNQPFRDCNIFSDGFVVFDKWCGINLDH